MGIAKKIGENLVDIAKNENLQNKSIDLLGMLFPYAGLEKKALDMYLEDIQKSNLPVEAKMIAVLNSKRIIKRLKNQKDIADIAINIAKEGTDFSCKSKVDDEWLDRFMESASFVNSDEMKLVWGKILANEFEIPGSTPQNMTRILSEFNQNLAKAFCTLCSMNVLYIHMGTEDKIDDALYRIIVPFDDNVDYMKKHGITFNVLNELDTLGVIKFDPVAGYAITNINNKTVLLYINGKTIEIQTNEQDKIPCGNVLLTEAGETLRRITNVKSIPNFEEILEKFMKEHNAKMEEHNHYKVEFLGDQVAVTKILDSSLNN